MTIRIFGAVVFLGLLSFAQASFAEGDGQGQGAAATDELETLKKEVLELNRDLFVLEEDLLFPASTQMAVYVSVDIGRYFEVDAVKLTMDGKEVTHHLYTARDLDALRRGGVQRLYVGNVGTGSHELVAIFTGYGPDHREYTRASDLKFVKETGAKYVELRIVDDTAKQQANFDVREW